LDADTGKLKWYYQFSPHDEFDYDSVQVPVLADMQWQGKDGEKRPRKLMLWANRNGLFYALDRTSGEFLMGTPFVEVTWMNGFDEKGRPMRLPGKTPTKEGTLVFPGPHGGTNWNNPAYSPRTGLFYVGAWDGYSAHFVKREDDDYAVGQRYMGGVQRSATPTGDTTPVPPTNVRNEQEGYGAIRALDAATGERKWEFKMNDVTDAGILTNASDLLFCGSREGYCFALDARTGALLWKAAVGGTFPSGPMTYS